MTITPLPAWIMEKVDERYRFIQYLESKRAMEYKIARVRKFYGVDEPMDMLRALNDTWDLEDIHRRAIMEYILRELMGASEEEVKRYMEKVSDSLDCMAEAVEDMHQS